ncbi:MAG: flagellar biosynthesis anti-sigma factor FlgM [Planctomycetales bacterium]|nr:flagellar biosynthesis anti-sigma factor FlgM [Planctomycetales bacterium]NIM08406.1 flagellar biosynthesis anti-sigma factor FlgM [Planctomycetales bacterium]NIN07881.1 flagellar biosynthesis anti-sigma factor FlgM [Planctomycetales bacterium]NIN77011.1 flagellar biosynthesis anti-sigma factor FlgM [Planctomycetales bacterium]NIO34194.1 flagellar biosynthesis anti-sigma factor FlgM [Planctomycetales bacterium]
MQINGPSHVHGPQSISPTQPTNPAQPAGLTEAIGGDEVSISREADILSRIGELPDVRQERVDQIRAEIANGTYETQEKLDLAIARLLEEIA